MVPGCNRKNRYHNFLSVINPLDLSDQTTPQVVSRFLTHAQTLPAVHFGDLWLKTGTRKTEAKSKTQITESLDDRRRMQVIRDCP